MQFAGYREHDVECKGCKLQEVHRVHTAKYELQGAGKRMQGARGVGGNEQDTTLHKITLLDKLSAR